MLIFLKLSLKNYHITLYAHFLNICLKYFEIHITLHAHISGALPLAFSYYITCSFFRSNAKSSITLHAHFPGHLFMVLLQYMLIFLDICLLYNHITFNALFCSFA